jgi:hypothetical protein
MNHAYFGRGIAVHSALAVLIQRAALISAAVECLFRDGHNCSFHFCSALTVLGFGHHELSNEVTNLFLEEIVDVGKKLYQWL